MTQKRKRPNPATFRRRRDSRRPFVPYWRATEEQPAALLEPTCGTREPAFRRPRSVSRHPGGPRGKLDAEHLRRARAVLERRRDAGRVKLAEADFLPPIGRPWSEPAAGADPRAGKPALGNQSPARSSGKSESAGQVEFQNHNGLDAVAGKANFDISEWMLLSLVPGDARAASTLAMLCKSASRTKSLSITSGRTASPESSAIFAINAGLHLMRRSTPRCWSPASDPATVKSRRIYPVDGKEARPGHRLRRRHLARRRCRISEVETSLRAGHLEMAVGDQARFTR